MKQVKRLIERVNVADGAAGLAGDLQRVDPSARALSLSLSLVAMRNRSVADLCTGWTRVDSLIQRVTETEEYSSIHPSQVSGGGVIKSHLTVPHLV